MLLAAGKDRAVGATSWAAGFCRARAATAHAEEAFQVNSGNKAWRGIWTLDLKMQMYPEAWRLLEELLETPGELMKNTNTPSAETEIR